MGIDYWEGRYAVDDYIFGTAPNAFLSRQAALLSPGAKVLSLADGEGRNGVWMAEQGLDVTAQDFSPSGRTKAQQLAADRGVTLTFEASDIRSRDWDADAYDVVVGIFFQFLTPSERTQVFKGIRSTVKTGGLVLIEGYGEKQIEYGTGGPKILENLYTEDLLRDAFAGFTKLDVQSYDAEISEGSGHAGMSALVDLIGTKQSYASGASITTAVSCGTTL